MKHSTHWVIPVDTIRFSVTSFTLYTRTWHWNMAPLSFTYVKFGWNMRWSLVYDWLRRTDLSHTRNLWVPLALSCPPDGPWEIKMGLFPFSALLVSHSWGSYWFTPIPCSISLHGFLCGPFDRQTGNWQGPENYAHFPLGTNKTVFS